MAEALAAVVVVVKSVWKVAANVLGASYEVQFPDGAKRDGKYEAPLEPTAQGWLDKLNAAAIAEHCDPPQLVELRALIAPKPTEPPATNADAAAPPAAQPAPVAQDTPKGKAAKEDV